MAATVALPTLLSAAPRQTDAATTAPRGPTCAVRLIDRRTGQTHRINGSPLVLFTRNPAEAAEDLLMGRDSAVWEARIEPIETQSRA